MLTAAYPVSTQPEVTSTATVHVFNSNSLGSQSQKLLLLNLQEQAGIPGPTLPAKQTCTRHAH